MSTTGGGRTGSQSIERALAVLRCLAASRRRPRRHRRRRPHRAVSNSTAHRLLQALRSDGLVAQDPRTERYHLGPGLVALGRRAEARLASTACCPASSELAAATGESVSLGTRSATRCSSSLHVDSPQPLRFDQPPGTHVPVHASAIGKALLAFSADPAAEVAALGELGGVHRRHADVAPTRCSPTSRSTRRRGWALNDGERHVGVRTMAAPLLDADGRPWAGVAVQGPAARLPDDRLDGARRTCSVTAAAAMPRRRT